VLIASLLIFLWFN